MVVMVSFLYEFNQRYSVGILCGISLSGDFLDEKRLGIINAVTLTSYSPPVRIVKAINRLRLDLKNASTHLPIVYNSSNEP
jgi:hypothetical protein